MCVCAGMPVWEVVDSISGPQRNREDLGLEPFSPHGTALSDFAFFLGQVACGDSHVAAPQALSIVMYSWRVTCGRANVRRSSRHRYLRLTTYRLTSSSNLYRLIHIMSTHRLFRFPKPQWLNSPNTRTAGVYLAGALVSALALLRSRLHLSKKHR